MFERATREKVRFAYGGLKSVEELWDLSLTALDAIYASLCEEIDGFNKHSLLEEKTAEYELIQFKMEIVKHIVSTKQEESRAAEIERAKSFEKKKILAAINKKKEQAYDNMSVEELEKRLSEME